MSLNFLAVGMWWLTNPSSSKLGSLPSLDTVRRYPTPNLFFKKSELPKHSNYPLAMMAIRSPRISASSMKWVVSTMTRPYFSSFSMFHNSLRAVRSIPEVGSSNITSCESPIRAIPTDSLRFCPPESDPAFALRLLSRPTFSMISLTC